eukprot:GFYU01002348.1.p1 GENE.GFYU01002348.1~~GFYU01002348.1.p1  ORF type:complete len:468 (-),score=99.91 GFYU01002348.1:165-1568(-)
MSSRTLKLQDSEQVLEWLAQLVYHTHAHWEHKLANAERIDSRSAAMTTAGSLAMGFSASLLVSNPVVWAIGAVVGGMLGYNKGKTGKPLVDYIQGLTEAQKEEAVQGVTEAVRRTTQLTDEQREGIMTTSSTLLNLSYTTSIELYKDFYRSYCKRKYRERFFQDGKTHDHARLSPTDPSLKPLAECAYLCERVYNFRTDSGSFFGQTLHWNNFTSDHHAKYVIVQDGDVLTVVFRGSHQPYDALVNLCALPAQSEASHSVHMGMYHKMKEVVKEIHTQLTALLKQQGQGTVRHLRFCGHSLGGAYAKLLYLELYDNPAMRSSVFDVVGTDNVKVYVYGAPMVSTTSHHHGPYETAVVSVVHMNDIVPRLLRGAQQKELQQLLHSTLNIDISFITKAANYQPVGTYYFLYCEDMAPSLYRLDGTNFDSAMSLIDSTIGYIDLLHLIGSVLDHSMSTYSVMLNKMANVQ